MSLFSHLERLRLAWAARNELHDAQGRDRSTLSSDLVARLDLAHRVRLGQLRGLDAAAKTISGNICAAIILAFILADNLGWRAMSVWIGLLVLCASALVWRTYWNMRHATIGRIPQKEVTRRLCEHIGFAVLIGLVWAGLILVYAPALTMWNLIILSLVVLGCISATVSSIGVHLPTFLGFALTTSFPLIYVHLIRPHDYSGSLALMVALYCLAITGNVLALHRSVIATFRLRAKNERLADNVAVARAATETAMRSKWESFAHLSHELRTPMNAVLGFSDIMRQQMFGPLGDRYLEYAGCIHESGSNALDLIESILAVSRAQTGDMVLAESDFDPVVLLLDCVSEMEVEGQSRGITLDVDMRPLDIGLHADRSKIRQVVLHLLSNAITYTNPGGRVLVKLRHEETGLLVTISDTGIGIAPEDLALCQEPFVRLSDPLIAQSKGAGLGLPIARHMLTAHGGSLSMESRLGIGTSVTFVLPPERCVPAGTQQSVVLPRPHLRLVSND